MEDTINFNDPKPSKNLSIKKFDKNNIHDVLDILDKHFKQIQSETGLKISTKGGSYLDFSFTTKLEVEIGSLTNLEPDAITEKQKSLWQKFYKSYGFEKEWLGKELNLQGKSYRIIGLNPRKPKFCVILYSFSDKKEVLTSEKTLIQNKSSIEI